MDNAHALLKFLFCLAFKFCWGSREPLWRRLLRRISTIQPPAKWRDRPALKAISTSMAPWKCSRPTINFLGGPDGQCFLGGECPAHGDYRLQLQQYGQRVGERLAREGALEYYGVDFMVTQRREGNWAVQAIEINLRRQGTTHPMMTMRGLI